MSSDDKMDISCPQCGKRLRVPVSIAGKKGRCPKCSTSFTIPDVIMMEAAPDPAPANDLLTPLGPNSSQPGLDPLTSSQDGLQLNPLGGPDPLGATAGDPLSDLGDFGAMPAQAPQLPAAPLPAYTPPQPAPAPEKKKKKKKKKKESDGSMMAVFEIIIGLIGVAAGVMIALGCSIYIGIAFIGAGLTAIGRAIMHATGDKQY